MSLKWFPNLVTLIRIACAPLVGALVWLAPSQAAPAAQAALYLFAFLIFSFACLTDWLDGYLARALKADSAFGAQLDLWADKIIVAAALVGALAVSPVIALFGLVSLTARDLWIMRLRARRPDLDLAATFLAKSKTAIVMAGMAGSLLGMAALRAASLGADAGTVPYAAVGLLASSLTLFALGCALSLVTAWQYLAAARTVPAP